MAAGVGHLALLPLFCGEMVPPPDLWEKRSPSGIFAPGTVNGVRVLTHETERRGMVTTHEHRRRTSRLAFTRRSDDQVSGHARSPARIGGSLSCGARPYSGRGLGGTVSAASSAGWFLAERAMD